MIRARGIEQDIARYEITRNAQAGGLRLMGFGITGSMKVISSLIE